MTRAKLLLVDDEPHNLLILRIFLSSLNYELYEAGCGLDALQAVDYIQPDLILLDIMMPDITGYEVSKQLNERADFQIPIIFLSADAQKEAVQRGKQYGVFDYLTKPFDLDLLQKTIEHALTSKNKF